MGATAEKIRMSESDYPDAMLVCDDNDDHPLYKTAPCFIAEALSPSTATIDQREKWLHYQDIPSLRYYLGLDDLYEDTGLLR